MGEVHVFGFMDIFEQEPDKFTIQYAKSKIDCPRCKKLIEKAEKLFADRPLLKKQDIAGICDHCWKQLVKIQKLVRLTQGKEDIAAATEAGVLKTQIEHTEKRLYDLEVKKPKGLKERATALGTLAPQTHILEGKTKDEKKLVREKSPGAEERISKARGEKPTFHEESQRSADKKSRGRDEKLIASGESQRDKDTKIISEKGETTSKQARGKQPTAREESLSATDKKSKAKDEQMTTQGESLRAKDKKSMPREESASAKDQKSKTRGEKPVAQKEPQSTRDQKSKAIGEKPIAQEEQQSTRDQKSKARGEKPLAQEEPQSTSDQKSKARGEKPIAQEEQSTRDQKSKAKGEKPIAQEEPQSARDQKSKAKGEKPIAQEEPRSARDQKSKAKGEKPIAQEEPQSARDQKSKAKGETPIAQEEPRSARDQKSKAKGEKPIAQEEPRSARDQKSKAKGEKPIVQEEPQSARDQKSKAKGEKPIAKEEPQSTRDQKSKAKVEQPIANDESLIAKDKKVKAKNEKSIAQEKEQIAKDNKTKSSVEAKEKTLKEKERKENTHKAKAEIAPREATSAEQMKALLADEKKRRENEKLEADNRKKQQQEEKQLWELAEKKVKETELHFAKESVKFAPLQLVLPRYWERDHDGDDDREVGHDVYKAHVGSDIIIGETICKHKIRKNTDVDLDTIEKVSFQKFGKHRTPSQPVARLDSSKKGKITGSESPVGSSERSKKGVEVSEKTDKGVKVKEKLEKTTKKPLQDSEAAINKAQGDGRIRYALSDPTFIDKGWTKLPLKKVVRKMNVYRMRPSRPEFDWFEHHKNRVLEYDTGERLAEVEDSGRGRWYYRNGALAMDYYDAEETNAGQRFVVYSSGAPDARGRPRPRTVLATFDHSGNGVVFDHAGKTRLKYNQTEGVVLDREIGPVSRWKWHTLNEPPVLQQVMVDTQLGHPDPDIARLGPEDEEPRPQDDAMLSIERDNFVKEKTRKSSQTFKPFQIKMKALKINENFSLRVLDQASVYLLYRDGSTNLKINIGMLLDHQEIVDMDAAEIGEVANTMDKLPARTRSIDELQRSVARAHAHDAARLQRRARLKGRPQGQLSAEASVDALHAAVSRPRPTDALHAAVSRPRPTHTLHTPLATCGASATHDHSELLKTCSCDLYCKPLF